MVIIKIIKNYFILKRKNNIKNDNNKFYNLSYQIPFFNADLVQNEYFKSNWSNCFNIKLER